ncbi:2-phosphosulfolactate phosphatase [Candidatus Poribacteria bacterium]|nr:2-phosphosulfolactate phosphatase [Candidatus Poribacteria bacterium]MBT5537093.1 2-phosphosulfolactate phosphatase [Candidatus Poribacteria bacterium]MBT5713640.1 2-phosphosulfolactate phosphatase [Candidatus Poribacteria bacterium]MBT7097674.1 2-phosphosulfolactate phosphatase [Candidatus Poribacteria bacterium]MBT7806153.1 2-phosphosulfolactate phosphatase [Candidatus Poribacteria bacterium]
MSRTLDVLLYLDEGGQVRPPTADAAVVAIDILRATSTITTAFMNGARSISPALTPGEALETRDLSPLMLLGGERGGVLIPGFDFGNSPREYTAEAVRGRDIAFTTTNGTRLMRALSESEPLYIGSYLNLSSVCEAVAGAGTDALIACAGTHGAFTLDDALFAGACVSRLRPAFDELTDTALAAMALWEIMGDDVVASTSATWHGRKLIELGFGADIEFCGRIDVTDVRPVLSSGVITLSR